eukprot:Em0019g1071a
MISGVVLSSIVGMLDDFAVLKVDSLTNAPFCSLIFFHGHIGVVTRTCVPVNSAPNVVYMCCTLLSLFWCNLLHWCQKWTTQCLKTALEDRERDRGKELSLLDDEPFRLVYQNGLGLQRCLRVFNVKMQLMKSMPRSINDAVELARKLELLSRHRGACAKKDGTTFQPQLSCPSEWGSAVTIIRADIWEKVSKCTVSTLAPATQAVVAANGKGLQLDGRVVLNIHIHVSRRRGSDLAVQPVGFVAVIMESISIPVNCEFQLVATLMVDGMMCRNSLGTPAQFHGASWFGSGTFGGNQQRWCNPSANVESSTQGANPVKQPPRKLPFHRRGNRTVQEHFQNLMGVFQRLKQAGLKLKPMKCHLFRNKITAPLNRLLEKGKQWQWTEQCLQAFTLLKTKLTSAPLLVYPNLEEAFIVDCVASDDGLGTVLSQNHQGAEHVVYYASRTLIKAEYHHALQWLRSFKGQVARWLEHLEEFEFTVQHRPGKKHGNADPLSRHPCHQCGNQPVTTDQRGSNSCMMPQQGDISVWRKVLEKAQQRFYWVDQRQDVEEWCRTCTICGAQKSPAKQMHPYGNGMIERFNRTLLSMLKRATIDAERDWDLKLPCLMMAYRTSTKATPFSFMALEQRLVAAYEHIREHLGIEQRRHKQFYDHKGHSKKLHACWKAPFTVAKVHLDDEPMPDESGREEHSLDETTEDEVLIQDGSRDEITSENQYEEVLVEREDDTLVRQTEPDMLQGVEHGTESQLVETGDATEEDPKKLVPEVDNNMESEEETPEAPEQEGLR